MILGRTMTGRKPYTMMYIATQMDLDRVFVIQCASKNVGRSTSQPSTPWHHQASSVGIFL